MCGGGDQEHATSKCFHLTGKLDWYTAQAIHILHLWNLTILKWWAFSRYFCLQSWQCWVFHVLMLIVNDQISQVKFTQHLTPSIVTQRLPRHSIKTKLAGNSPLPRKRRPACNCHLKITGSYFRCFPAQTLHQLIPAILYAVYQVHWSVISGIFRGLQIAQIIFVGKISTSSPKISLLFVAPYLNDTPEIGKTQSWRTYRTYRTFVEPGFEAEKKTLETQDDRRSGRSSSRYLSL